MKPTALVLALALAAEVGARAQAEAPVGPRIARAAESQVGVTLVYDPAYVRLDYPGGDVPRERGVCSDVVVRAFRAAGIDLQVLVHEDMRRHFAAYPQLWGLRGPDTSIDHRRVPNLMRFFERRGKQLAPAATAAPGDVIAWRLPNGLLHVGVVSSQRVAGSDRYLVVHNIGRGAQSEDVLEAFTLLGRYRW